LIETISVRQQRHRRVYSRSAVIDRATTVCLVTADRWALDWR